jgi:type I restriction enzyme R subunit
MEWLRMIKDHIITSVHLDKGDLDHAPFDDKREIGGFYQTFGDEMDECNIE